METINKLFGGGGGDSDLIKGLMETVQGSGGLNGLIGKFDAAGVGDKARSWVGTGPNQEVTGQEVRQALGEEEIDRLAEKAHMSPEDASSKIAGILPEAVNKLTPDGQIPDPGKVSELIKSLPGM
jgi:uncharacterized protein YidB (DUF937 family)